MISRHLGSVLRTAATRYPVVSVTGPRQSGKTTLVRSIFSNHEYLSLERPDLRTFALEDPRGFLDRYDGAVIFDEAQRVPDLFSYLQVDVDEDPAPGRVVLTGSQNFLLAERISQTLAGRAFVSHLLPFSLGELAGRRPVAPERMIAGALRRKPFEGDLFEILLTGLFPRIHDLNLPPQEWLAQYQQTYLERDVRDLSQVGNLETFYRFIRLVAARAGQLLNLSSLGNDCGVSHETARRWLSVLETSFVVFRLQPHHKNFNKRLVKSPKVYLYDSGLLCYLLRIRSPEELATHSMRGPIFENFLIAELMKSYYHAGTRPDLYFWRNHRGDEIDLLIDRGDALVPVEIKSGQTVSSSYFRALDYWQKIGGDDREMGLVYGGDESYRRQGVTVASWRQWV